MDWEPNVFRRWSIRKKPKPKTKSTKKPTKKKTNKSTKSQGTQGLKANLKKLGTQAASAAIADVAFQATDNIFNLIEGKDEKFTTEWNRAEGFAETANCLSDAIYRNSPRKEDVIWNAGMGAFGSMLGSFAGPPGSAIGSYVAVNINDPKKLGDDALHLVTHPVDSATALLEGAKETGKKWGWRSVKLLATPIVFISYVTGHNEKPTAFHYE